MNERPELGSGQGALNDRLWVIAAKGRAAALAQYRTLPFGCGPYHYRYSGAETEEGCFLACSFWMVEAWALLGERTKAEGALDRLVAALGRGVGVWTEIADPATGAFLGNMPQGLTHLAHIMALDALARSSRREPKDC